MVYIVHRGYIKIWRKTEDSGLFQLPFAFTLFAYMLMKASHKPIRFGTVDIQRGQLCTGRHKLAEELGMTEQSIRTALKHLHKMEMLTSKPTNKYTVYTIVNYNNYQDNQPTDNQQTNQQLTNEQPTTNQQLTTIQEHKHISIKELKKEEGAAFALPDWVDKTHWDIWVKARKKMNNDQKQMQVDKLKAWKDEGLDFAGALANAAANGTQGLFLPDSKKTFSRTPSIDNFSNKDYGQGVNDL